MNTLIEKMKNITVLNYSACTSAVVEPFHILLAIGADKDGVFTSLNYNL